MKVSSLFKGKSSRDIEISSPHTEKGAPQPTTQVEAKRATRSIVPTINNLLPFGSAKVHKKEASIAQREREPYCMMESLKFAPRHLVKMAELRAMCAPDHHATINKALDGIFMIAVASESLNAFRTSKGNVAWSALDLTHAKAVSSLADHIYAKYGELKKSSGVNLQSIDPLYEHQARETAIRFISHLAISIAYDQGAKIDGNAVASNLYFNWSSQSADAALMDTFAPTIRTDVKANWMSTLDVLVNISKYCTPHPSQPNGNRSTGRGPFTQYTTNNPPAGAKHADDHSQPAGAHSSTDNARASDAKQSAANSQAADSNEAASKKSAYQAALHTGTNVIAGIIGKMPPDVSVVPQCDQSRSGMVYGLGNIVHFFGMSTTDTSEDAQRQVRNQYRAILRQIHPDKHAGEDYEVLRAYVELTKIYTAAHEEATKWFRSANI